MRATVRYIAAAGLALIGIWGCSSPTLADTLEERFRAVHDYARAQGYVGGFPNLHEADYGEGKVYGTILLKPGEAEWRDIPVAALGNPTGAAARFRAVYDYAKAQGFVGGFPNFHEADYGHGKVYGTILIKPGEAEWRDIPAAALGNPGEAAARFRAVYDYAKAQDYVGGFPNFHEADYGHGQVYGTILLKAGVAEWRDVVAVDLCTKVMHANYCLGRLTFSTGQKTPYYRNHPINRPSKQITRAVIVVHGINRNADSYFMYVRKAAQIEGRLKNTVIIAPKFQRRKDGPKKDEHRWSAKWSQGDQSTDGRLSGSSLSSFSAIDEIYEKILASFPNIETIVLVGHSAGGQFINRYAAGGRAPGRVSIPSMFVVANPSSYLYIDNRRWVLQAQGFGWVLTIPGGCGKYNDYKYGLDKLNPYMSKTGIPEIKNNVHSRNVYYFVGENDIKRGDLLDDKCPAERQGLTRFDRACKYNRYIRVFPAWHDNVEFRIIDSVAHSASDMINSTEIRKVLFVRNVTDPALPSSVCPLGMGKEAAAPML